ncbi:MAG: hypothetical protein JSV58_00285 [Candidatus Bathyarchaeota archaeon]|nr:MAG: hypothetical protein JSV58_00285 [Candidatus Bathyarchaeota archaeon]
MGPERNPYLCAAGAFFFPGLEQVYCGRILRGVTFLIPAILLTIPYGLMALTVHLGFPGVDWWTYWASLITPISKVVDFAVRVIAAYDAIKVAKLTRTD